MTDVSQQLIQARIKDLRENTDFVATLFESLVGYAIIAADFDGNIIAYNEGARQIYGYAPQEIIGRQNMEIFFPEEFIDAGALQRVIDDLMGKGRVSFEGEKVRKGGERFPAQVLFTLTKDRGGRVVGFIEIVGDLTERRRAEEARQQLELQQLRLQQLEQERAEAVRNYQHYLAISQGGGAEAVEALPDLDPETLHGLIPDYWDVVINYVRAVRIREDRPSERVRDFARQLAGLRARARDVVRIHLGVLNQFAQRAMPSDERAFSNDARLVLVELLGSLMDIYLNASRSAHTST